MAMIFDSHAHYDDEAFDADRAELLGGLREKRVCGVLNAASNLPSARRCVALAEEFPFLWAAVGVHPIDAETATEGYLSQLRELAKCPKVVAIGEIGLDFHYDTPKEVQFQVLREQLALAKELDLPVILHDREAHGPILEILKEFRPKGVVHCFSGSVEMAREVLDLGMYIGLGGAVTFKNAVQPPKVAAYVPEDRLLLETDCPYMAPVPCRGKRCDSSMIAYTAEKIAQLRGVTAEKILTASLENVERLFGIRVE